MGTDRMFFVGNPAARIGEIDEDLLVIQEELTNSGIVFHHQFTERPGHAKEIAKQAMQQGYNIIVAVGGDGTANEIASALIGTKACLGIIPIGSGNDLARSLGIPRDIREAIKILLSGKKREIDVIKVAEKYIFNVLGIGFDAAVAQWVKERRKWLPRVKVAIKKMRRVFPWFRWWKLLAWLWENSVYLVGVLAKIFTFRNLKIEIITPERQLKVSCMLVACAIGKSEGRHFLIAPEASMNDGLIDVCVVSEITSWQERFNCLVKGLKGKHLLLDKVIYFKTKRLRIISPGPLLAHIDGEPIQLPSNFEVTLIPCSLQVIVGPDFAGK